MPEHMMDSLDFPDQILYVDHNTADSVLSQRRI